MAPPLIPLRPMPTRDDARVRAFVKLVRDHTLPPVLVWWVEGFCSYFVIDGHDRLAAAIVADQQVPILALCSVRDRDEAHGHGRAKRGDPYAQIDTVIAALPDNPAAHNAAARAAFLFEVDSEAVDRTRAGYRRHLLKHGPRSLRTRSDTARFAAGGGLCRPGSVPELPVSGSSHGTTAKGRLSSRSSLAKNSDVQGFSHSRPRFRRWALSLVSNPQRRPARRQRGRAILRPPPVPTREPPAHGTLTLFCRHVWSAAAIRR
jgi:hypothetical protein